MARAALGLGAFTIAYNVVEGVVAVIAGLAAGAVSLIGFGLDSGIEVLSAIVVVVRLSAEVRGGEPDERKEKLALRFVAATFFLLAAYLVIEGIRDLIVGERPETSVVGIVLTALSIVIMPTLAAVKRRVGLRMGSALVVADAAETRLCAVLSVTTFIALLAYLLLGWTWLDPVAGFVIAVFAVLEGREAWEGSSSRSTATEGRRTSPRNQREGLTRFL
uniref:cation diffusion facilitator family transporter n=1 Tax=Amnibacterium kyonggiense TaxID=595671 RepID=UPI00247AFE4F|nr:cation transporter [Amnibacterium kyonggiense]